MRKQPSRQSILANLNSRIAVIKDKEIRDIQAELMNLIEMQATEIIDLKEENQKLKDENNRLKGEQGKLKIRKQSKGNKKDHSSETERNRKQKDSSKDDKNPPKKDKKSIKVDREVRLDIDPDLLPDDAEFRGYATPIFQDITITTDNVKFIRPRYYSPSLKKVFIADLPPGYDGRYGPKLKALSLDLHSASNMTVQSLANFFTNHGIYISESTVSRILNNDYGMFIDEAKDIFVAGLKSTVYQQIDDTGARVKGQNYYTHVICNPLYSCFFTRPHKDRLTIIDLLMQGSIQFIFSDKAFELMQEMNLSDKQIARLIQYSSTEQLKREGIDKILSELFPDPSTYATSRKIILEATAIAAYQASENPIKILLADDAPQFNLIAEFLAGCWVHDGRHYKKLSPVLKANQNKLDAFIMTFWDYYHELLAYKKCPANENSDALKEQFDQIFSTQTGYQYLDDRIAKTKEKKDKLLLALDYPELPLHNNTSELGARKQARYRDVSFHTMSEMGTAMKDALMTISETAKKVTVSSYRYTLDRITKKYDMPSLASVITEKSSQPVIDTG